MYAFLMKSSFGNALNNFELFNKISVFFIGFSPYPEYNDSTTSIPFDYLAKYGESNNILKI
ncbi:MAG: hypothetical protein NVS1B13_26500 [Flavisolibacter sp.]